MALGTVTHENIGYLLPDGPLLLGAGRAPRAAVGGPAAVDGLAALRRRGRGALPLPGHRADRARAGTWPRSAFMFTPYVLQYAGRISVILLPWAGPAVDGGLRRPGPAAGRLEVPGPVRPGGGPGQRHQRQLDPLRGHRPRPCGSPTPCWSPARPPGAGRGGWPGGSACSAPWSPCGGRSGSQVEAAYGVNVLKYTETVPATSSRLAGLGDPPGPRLLVLLRLGPDRGLDPGRGGLHPEPVAGRRSASPCRSWPSSPPSLLRWRYRAYFVLLVVVGMVLAVGRLPLRHPTGGRVGCSSPSWSTPRPGWPCAPPTGPRR